MKRTVLALLLGVLLPPLSLAQTTPPPAAPPQVSIAVGTFACKTSGCTYELGSGTADALTTALLETGRFSVYERENMATLTEENVLSSTTPTQGFQGADVLIFGSITQLDASGSGSGLCLFGVCVGGHDSVVGADLRIVDAKSRQVIAATHVEGKSSSNAVSLNLSFFSGSTGSTSGVQTAMADMLKNAVNQLTQKIPARYYRAETPAANAPVAAAAAAPQPALAAAPAPSTAAPVAVTLGWVNQFFFLDDATRQRACAEGFSSAAAGASATVPGHAELTSTEGKLTINTSYNSIFLACQSLGLKAQAQPQSVPQLDFVIHHIVNERVQANLKALSLLFVSSSGTVLGRFDIFSADNVHKYCLNDSQDCPVPLTPNTLDNSTRAAISQADSIQFLVNFGKGIETLTLSKARFPNLK